MINFCTSLQNIAVTPEPDKSETQSNVLNWLKTWLWLFLHQLNSTTKTSQGRHLVSDWTFETWFFIHFSVKMATDPNAKGRTHLFKNKGKDADVSIAILLQELTKWPLQNWCVHFSQWQKRKVKSKWGCESCVGQVSCLLGDSNFFFTKADKEADICWDAITDHKAPNIPNVQRFCKQ